MEFPNVRSDGDEAPLLSSIVLLRVEYADPSPFVAFISRSEFRQCSPARAVHASQDSHASLSGNRSFGMWRVVGGADMGGAPYVCV